MITENEDWELQRFTFYIQIFNVSTIENVMKTYYKYGRCLFQK